MISNNSYSSLHESPTKLDFSTEKLVQSISEVLDDSKAENIKIIDIKDRSDIAEIMIVATGRSDRHIKSTAEHICKYLKEQNIGFATEGVDQKNWVLVDAISVIIHIFNSETRSEYKLEEMWSE